MVQGASSEEMISFDDTAIAFQHLSDSELRKRHLLFQLLFFPGMVRLGPRLADLAIRIGGPLRQLVRDTLFQQFCGGETRDECLPLIEQLAAHHVGTILDFASEGKVDEGEISAVVQETLDNIALAAQKSAIPFCVVKPSGLVSRELLEKQASEQPLSVEQAADWQRFQQRFFHLCQAAAQQGVRLLIDAEESWIQSPVDALVEEAMRRFNRHQVIVYNTLQMYRVDRLAYLDQALRSAQREAYILGFKLVRGAYLEKERQRAQHLAYPSPLFSSKKETDEAFDQAGRLCLAHHSLVQLCVGTHNQSSIEQLLGQMAQRGIGRDDPSVYFSQLFGMSDHLTFHLALKGYRVAKYLPYGPLEDLLPYLSRRAQENSAIQGQTGREVQYLQKERRRRRQVGL
jgi:proline dehydrogenase